MSKQRDTDVLWKMLSDELSFADIREVEAWMQGESDFTEMGYGRLTIEPYDAVSGGRAGTFRLSHDRHGGTTVTRSALATVLNDLIHDIRRRKGGGDPVHN